MGNLPCQRIAKLVFGQIHIGLGDRPGADFFSEFFIRNAKDLNIADFWMPDQVLFDLAWIDVFATADNHILHPPHD